MLTNVGQKSDSRTSLPSPPSSWHDNPLILFRLNNPLIFIRFILATPLFWFDLFYIYKIHWRICFYFICFDSPPILCNMPLCCVTQIISAFLLRAFSVYSDDHCCTHTGEELRKAGARSGHSLLICTSDVAAQIFKENIMYTTLNCIFQKPTSFHLRYIKQQEK